jgi:ubiquinone/menaquinone biosynthesis C-methylase UbiE
MQITSYNTAPGHWILARMGKKVLRPGGKDLTLKLMRALCIARQDDVVEFAPGLGFTASLALECNPKSYLGIDTDEDAIKRLDQKIKGNSICFIKGNAAQTGLPDESKDKVFGEAMLTMHADHRKSEIVKEANRILKKGGLYAIHELGLFPADLTEQQKSGIQRDLALSIKVNARPLTEQEWKELLCNEGFRIVKIEINPMCLLEPARMIDDEGFFGALKIGFNILSTPLARKRIVQMRKTFKKHCMHMNAIAIIAQKI